MGQRSIVMSMSVCKTACLWVYLQNCTLDLQILCTCYRWLQFVPVAVLQCYVLPVLWTTSFLLHIMARNRQCEKGVFSKWLDRGQDIFDAVAYTTPGAAPGRGWAWYLRLSRLLWFVVFKCIISPYILVWWMIVVRLEENEYIPDRTGSARLGPVHFGPKIIKYSTWRHNQYGDTAKNI